MNLNKILKFIPKSFDMKILFFLYFDFLFYVLVDEGNETLSVTQYVEGTDIIQANSNKRVEVAGDESTGKT